jgi:hypothetical protein
MSLSEIGIASSIIKGEMNLSLAFMTLYLSVVTGYLVVAYLAGSKLSRFQVTFVTILFVVFSVHLTVSSYGAFEAAYIAHLKYFPDEVIGPSPILNRGLAVFQLAGIIGCLTFMWDVRKSKP